MKVSKEFKFAASHTIPGHKGKCANFHGHNYRVVVGVHGLLEDGMGMVVDFDDLGAAVTPLVDLLDHRHINDYIRQPTAENIAAWFGSVLGRMADGHILKLVTVTVHETDSCLAEWASVNDLDVVRHLQSWREPANITEANKERMAVARRAATDAVNQIILANRPRAKAILGDGGSIG